MIDEKTLENARWFEKTDDPSKSVRCLLCPRKCVIPDGKTGFCAIRENMGGQLKSIAYGRATALQIDPIEKKPLRHFMPGTRTFSIGSYGCNLACVFCQNDHLSRAVYNKRSNYRYYSPADMVALAMRHGCESISFTYNEPSVWEEYVYDTAVEAKKHGIPRILVSNGFISPEAAAELYPLMDAANIDVKGFSEEYYRTMCHASLEPVKQSCEYFKNAVGGHLELTNLVIPNKNNSKEMIDAYLDWVEEKLGKDTPLHYTAYHPAYKYHESPRTPIEMLEEIQAYTKSRGFPRVYLGNIC